MRKKSRKKGFGNCFIYVPSLKEYVLKVPKKDGPILGNINQAVSYTLQQGLDKAKEVSCKLNLNTQLVQNGKVVGKYQCNRRVNPMNLYKY